MSAELAVGWPPGWIAAVRAAVVDVPSPENSSPSLSMLSGPVKLARIEL